MALSFPASPTEGQVYAAPNGNWTFAGGRWVPPAFTGGVTSVNDDEGPEVMLNAADVGALPDTYTPPAPAWNDVTGKPTFTSAGLALVDDANAAAQRTTLGISAANTPFTPAGTIAATTVQAAIEEVAAEAAPGLVLLGAGNIASGTLDLKLALPTTYRRFQLILQSVVPDVTVRPLALDVSTDNGATFISTSSYMHGLMTQRITTPAGSGSASDTKILLTTNAIYTGEMGANLTINIDCAPSRHTRLNWQGSMYTATNDETAVWGHGAFLSPTRITNIRIFFFSNGNFDTNLATYALYAVRHA